MAACNWDAVVAAAYEHCHANSGAALLSLLEQLPPPERARVGQCVCASDAFGNTPLHAASHHGAELPLRLLLAAGAAPNCRAANGSTPLHAAAAGGASACVAVLLSAGADPGAVCGRTGGGAPLLPADSAEARGHVALARLLRTAAARGAQELPNHTLAHTGPGAVAIQLASDLHLEFGAVTSYESLIRPAAPVLALLGDVGVLTTAEGCAQYAHFLEWCAHRFALVLVLLGNHEYNQGQPGGRVTADVVQLRLHALCASAAVASGHDVRMLQRAGVRVNGVRVLGATLWSAVPAAAAQAVEAYLSDYRLIWLPGDPPRLLTAAASHAAHEEDVAWLRAQLADGSGGPTAVLTHHTPSCNGTSHPKYGRPPANPVNHAFSTDLEALFRPSLRVWAFGHTHYNADFQSCVRRHARGVQPKGVRRRRAGTLPHRRGGGHIAKNRRRDHRSLSPVHDGSTAWRAWCRGRSPRRARRRTPRR